MHTIGTRFKIVQTGNVNPRYVGATGEVIGYFGSLPSHHQIRFDDETLSGLGSWSYEALEPLTDDAPDPCGDTGLHVGQRVEVVGYSPEWDGPATITRWTGLHVVVNPDSDRGEGGFDPRLVRPLDESAPDFGDLDLRDLDPAVKPGDRVRCTQGGEGFPGLVGTVTGEDFRGPISFRVRWDTPPSMDVNSTAREHGGTWNLNDIEVIERPDIIYPDASDCGGVTTDKRDLPDADTVQRAGLDPTRRSVHGGYTWEDVARAAIEALTNSRAATDNVLATAERDKLDALGNIDDLSARLRGSVQQVTDAKAENESLRQRLNQSNSALDYAVDRLSSDDRSRVFGYLDGIKAGL